MIRLPILKDELAFLQKIFPELQTRPDLGHLAIEINARIEKIRQEIRAVEEKVSLSDRFGLWLGFHNGSQDQYFDMIRGYVAHHKLKIDDDQLIAEAIEWSMTRGGRSGRVAWQFIQDLAGRLGQSLQAE